MKNLKLFFFELAVVLIVCITRIAKSALEKALAENEDYDDYDDIASAQLPVVAVAPLDLKQPLIIKIEPTENSHEK